MNGNTSNKIEDKNIRLVDSNKTYKLIIPERVEKMIREWCKLNPNTEWSGTLFYTANGSFENEDIEFTVQDFFVSDIGTAGFTSYKVTPDICNYMIEKDLLDCKTGLIHSHNQMAAFFSGTDANTLLNEGIDSCHYLSLVVNNAGKYVARVTRRLTETFIGKRVVKYPSYDGIEISNEQDCNITNLEKVEYSNLDIIIENSMKDTADEINARYNELISQKKHVETIGFPTQKNLFGFDSEAYIKGNSNVASNYDFYKNNEKKDSFSKTEEKETADNCILSDEIIDEDSAMEMAAQILYGNITLTIEQFRKFNNVDAWIKEGMIKVFDKRFYATPKDNKNSVETYDDFMYSFISIIISSYAEEYIDFYKSEVDEDYINMIIAQSITDSLDELVEKAFGSVEKNKNPYIDMIYKNLELYTK